MLTLKVFCFCMPPRKASLALGCAGIIISIMMIVPPCLILENHDFYFNEYISRQKSYADSGKICIIIKIHPILSVCSLCPFFN